eukprot:TRINITY_DN3535_c0_g1_i1.p1 TRINITY_DN3535_c0_g1~~TRINITY_DN3535_c0_g1_i1.p1  ORF type:complete len:329 (-),score=55.54 TRINITY_DN3535_c0_g1_i1:400-1386(-)
MLFGDPRPAETMTHSPFATDPFMQPSWSSPSAARHKRLSSNAADLSFQPSADLSFQPSADLSFQPHANEEDEPIDRPQRRAKAHGAATDPSAGLLLVHQSICEADSPSHHHTRLRTGVLQSWGLAHRPGFLTDMRALHIGAETRRMRICTDLALARTVLFAPSHISQISHSSHPIAQWHGPLIAAAALRQSHPPPIHHDSMADASDLSAIPLSTAVPLAALTQISLRMLHFFVGFFAHTAAERSAAERSAAAIVSPTAMNDRFDFPMSASVAYALRVSCFVSSQISPEYTRVGMLRYVTEIDSASDAIWILLEIAPTGQFVVIPPFRQ